MKSTRILMLSVITSIIIVASISTTSINADVKAFILSAQGDGRGYAGASGTITIGISVYGVTTRVSIHVNGINAYDALAAAIGGIYDDGIHKWVAFGGNSLVESKDYKTFAGDEWYNFYLASYVPCNVRYSDDGMFIKIYCKSSATFDVKHCVWYGEQCYEWYDFILVYPNVLIPKNALSVGSNVGISISH